MLDWLWSNQKKEDVPVQELPKAVSYPCGCNFSLWEMLGTDVRICPKHWKIFDHSPIGYLVHCMRTGNYPPLPKDEALEVK